MSQENSRDENLTPVRNRLQYEKSPYLLQHADNPVNWYPWGKEAFARAKSENKPIFLSIGYSTCHWCHVMEEESFENPDIADILNKYFIAIKVDREERPDIDQLYMQAVVGMTGSGGWPLNLFLTPQKQPFMGGTYFPPQSRWGRAGFKEILLSVQDVWSQRQGDVLDNSQKIVDWLTALNQSHQKGRGRLDIKMLDDAYIHFERAYDQSNGGFGSAPKFPSAQNILFLLRYTSRLGHENARAMVINTLDQMGKGGIYDHVGGGFHRYATDQRWQVPHFEKMLYDQAMMSRLYFEAYQYTQAQAYQSIACRTLDFVLKEMTSPLGGFYTAFDADSLDDSIVRLDASGQRKQHKKEGAFYLWTYADLADALGEDFELFRFMYNIKPNGNIQHDPHQEFTGKNIIYQDQTIETVSKKFKLPPAQVVSKLDKAKKVLYARRFRRSQPQLDDKVLVDLNGMMISSFVLGYRVTGHQAYLDAAESAADFVNSRLIRKDGRLLHRFRDGEAAIEGHLDDYAYFFQALLDLYQVTFTFGYLEQAHQLQREMVRLFWDESGKSFYFTGDDADPLLIRPKEVNDGAIPSGHSVALFTLLQLAQLTGQNGYKDMALDALHVLADDINSRPRQFAYLLLALEYHFSAPQEIVFSGEFATAESAAIKRYLQALFLPSATFSFRPLSDQAAQQTTALLPYTAPQKAINNSLTVYICENHACKKPVVTLEAVKKLLHP